MTVIMTDNPSIDLELRRRQLKSQPSTLQGRKQHAVCVRRAYKRYGSSSNPFVVLDGLNMTVPKGSIYGLLGASGCGKTTLLSCIVGRKTLNSGEIWVLGGTPGSNGSGVPGPRIGYMPQAVSLYAEFTIKETLLYFGWIAGMKRDYIEERIDFLVNLLMLPKTSQRIKNLSGGQQRRVSLASALIHEPELLILDEPTVGVDPLLRQNIWDHLVSITKTGNTTAIITTHYIDETRQASLIGLMRGGYFLAEESPSKLLAQFNAQTLEEVFLKLSILQNKGRHRSASIAQDVISNIDVPTGFVNETIVLDDITGEMADEISGEFGDNISISSYTGRRVSIAPTGDDVELPTTNSDMPPDESVPKKWTDYMPNINIIHLQALLWKNFLWMVRNIPAMLFILGLPILEIALFCLTIGHDPINVPVAIVNYESHNAQGCEETLMCNATRLSCNYLGYLERRALNLKYYDSEESARESVFQAKTYASIVIHENYTTAMQTRIEDWRAAPADVVYQSEIEVLRDISSKAIATYLKVYLYETFQTFIQDYLETCGLSRKVIALPIRWEKPVYGTFYPNFTDFATPGIILTVIFFLAVALTSGAMLIERNEGSLERSLVIGITPIELLMAHVIGQFSVMIGQSIMVMVFAFAVFDMTLEGSLVWVSALTLLTGFCGMCFGFVVSCVCDSERTATYLAMGSFLPIVMLCGIIWPIEAMHYLLQVLSFFLPLTQATESMRSMLQRGWGITVPIVYYGFISITIWIFIFLIICILFLKFKKG